MAGARTLGASGTDDPAELELRSYIKKNWPVSLALLAEAWRVWVGTSLGPRAAAAVVSEGLLPPGPDHEALQVAFTTMTQAFGSRLKAGGSVYGVIKELRHAPLASSPVVDDEPDEPDPLGAQRFTERDQGYFFVPWSEFPVSAEEVAPSFLEKGKPDLSGAKWLGCRAAVSGQLTFEAFRADFKARGVVAVLADLDVACPPGMGDVFAPASDDVTGPILWAFYNTFGRQQLTFEPSADLVDFGPYCKALMTSPKGHTKGG